jgi:hypothetical protein
MAGSRFQGPQNDWPNNHFRRERDALGYQCSWLKELVVLSLANSNLWRLLAVVFLRQP